MQVSQTVQTIIRQVYETGCVKRGTKLLIAGDEKLVVSFVQATRARKFRNVEIEYVAGLDVYTITVHTIDRRTLETDTRVYEDQYCDQIADRLVGPLV